MAPPWRSRRFASTDDLKRRFDVIRPNTVGTPTPRCASLLNAHSELPSSKRRTFHRRIDAGPFPEPAGKLRPTPQSGGCAAVSSRSVRARASHLSDEEIAENFELSLVPRPLTAMMIERAIPEAIRPYSVAVAPR